MLANRPPPPELCCTGAWAAGVAAGTAFDRVAGGYAAEEDGRVCCGAGFGGLEKPDGRDGAGRAPPPDRPCLGILSVWFGSEVKLAVYAKCVCVDAIEVGGIVIGGVNVVLLTLYLS